MAIISKEDRFAGSLIPALIGIFISASLAPAQTKQILTWQEDLTYLQNAAADELMQAQAAVVRIRNNRYEGGITLQDTTYIRTSPSYLPFGTSYGTVDLGAMVPVSAGFSVQAGVKNLLDRDYYYTAGFPEAGRNWYFNLRYRF